MAGAVWIYSRLGCSVHLARTVLDFESHDGLSVSKFASALEP